MGSSMGSSMGSMPYPPNGSTSWLVGLTWKSCSNNLFFGRAKPGVRRGVGIEPPCHDGGKAQKLPPQKPPYVSAA